MTLEALAEMIKKAFAASNYPGDKNILLAGLSQDHPDTEIARERFVGKKWWMIPCNEILSDSQSLYSLSPIGAAYFCPQIMLCSLYDEEYGNIFSWQELVIFDNVWSWLLNTVEEDEYRKYNKAFRDALSDDEKRTVAIYVKFLAERQGNCLFYNIEKARKAYKDIWSQFC